MTSSDSRSNATAGEATAALAVDGLALGGDGVARLDGKVVFVAGALPGERVMARLVENRPSYARAEVVSIEVPSPDRRDRDCRHEVEDGCGGCGLRHLRHAQGLQLKTEAALGELAKLSGAASWPRPTLDPELSPDGARHRLRFHAGRRDVGPGARLGLYRRGTHELVSIPDCRAAHPGLLSAAAEVERALTGAHDGRHVSTVLLEWADGRAWATASGRLGDGLRQRLAALVRPGCLAALCLDSGRRRATIGAPWIVERARVGGRELTYQRRPGTFAQANPAANQRIRERLHEVLTGLGPRSVLDLYAGSGNLSLVAALTAERVVGVEVDAAALDGLTASAEASGLGGVVARRRDLSRGLSRPLASLDVDAVVLDPPRSGARPVLGGIEELKPSDVLYVSCSPAHLARDVARLAARYDVVALDAFDMFPRTPHLELLAHLRRRPA